MPGSTVPVSPGPAVQLQGAPLDNGFLLYNNDAVNSIWISSVQAVSPGNGILLGPFATAQWSYNKGLPWACVDTGVTTPVLITITNDVSTLDNPAAVAAATAAALLLQGVPQVFVQEEVYNGTVPYGQLLPLDVSKYASIIVMITSATDPFNFVLVGAPEIGAESATISMSAASPGASAGSWTIPVTSKQVDIINYSPTTANPKLIVIGTNRTSPKPVQNPLTSKTTTLRVLSYTGATVAGVPVQLTAADGGAVYTDFNYSVAGLFETGVNSPTSSGLIIKYRDPVSINQPLLSADILQRVANTQATSVLIAHPISQCEWWVNPATAVAAASYKLTLGQLS